VRGENDGHAAFAQAADHFPHVTTQLNIDARGGLVEEQDRRLVGQRLGDHHPTLHAAGKLEDAGIALVPQRQIAQQFLQERIVRRLAKQPARKTHCRPDALESFVEQFLRHQSDLRAGGAVVLDDVVAVDQYATAAGIDDAADDADQRGLAGAVGAEQGEDLALADVEVDALERRVAGSVSLGELLDGDHWLHGLVSSRNRGGIVDKNAT